MTFGARLRELRKHRQLTMRELAARAEVNVSVVSRAETETYGVPTVRTIERLSRALGLSEGEEAELLMLAGHMPPETQLALTERVADLEIRVSNLEKLLLLVDKSESK